MAGIRTIQNRRPRSSSRYGEIFGYERWCSALTRRWSTGNDWGIPPRLRGRKNYRIGRLAKNQGKSQTSGGLTWVSTRTNSLILPPEVRDIAERVVRKKRQFPGASVKIRKRDISNAFKRAPLRPDYSAIFCHQCDALSAEIEGGAAL